MVDLFADSSMNMSPVSISEEIGANFKGDIISKVFADSPKRENPEEQIAKKRKRNDSPSPNDEPLVKLGLQE